FTFTPVMFSTPMLNYTIYLASNHELWHCLDLLICRQVHPMLVGPSMLRNKVTVSSKFKRFRKRFVAIATLVKMLYRGVILFKFEPSHRAVYFTDLSHQHYCRLALFWITMELFSQFILKIGMI